MRSRNLVKSVVVLLVAHGISNVEGLEMETPSTVGLRGWRPASVSLRLTALESCLRTLDCSLHSAMLTAREVDRCSHYQYQPSQQRPTTSYVSSAASSRNLAKRAVVAAAVLGMGIAEVYEMLIFNTPGWMAFRPAKDDSRSKHWLNSYTQKGVTLPVILLLV